MTTRQCFESDVQSSSYLDLRSLQWNPDRDEHAPFVKKTIIHKEDPECTWYRPREVFIQENRLMFLQKYLSDLETYTQYTQGEMMVKLGYPTACLNDLIEGKNSPQTSPLSASIDTVDPSKPLLHCQCPVYLADDDVTDTNVGVNTTHNNIRDVNPYIGLIISGEKVCDGNTTPEPSKFPPTKDTPQKGNTIYSFITAPLRWFRKHL